MPRKPDVRYYPSRGAYYAQIRGRKHLLASGPDDRPDGPTFKAAFAKFWELRQEADVGVAGETNSVRVILKAYLDHIRGRRKQSTISLRERDLSVFIAAHGTMRVQALTHHTVYQFINTRRRGEGQPHTKKRGVWGESAEVNFLASLQAAFNWAVKARLIPSNPLKGIETPDAVSLGAEKVLTHEEQDLVRKAASPLLREIIVVLECTGCRPGELIAATAAEYREEMQSLVFPPKSRRRPDGYRHKTAGKGRSRVIVLAGPALEIIKARMARYPTGPLFRRRNGKPWNGHKLSRAFANLREKIGLPDLTAYSYRHTYATRWLLSGRSIDQLAEVLGNSPEVLRKHYSHLESDRGMIRQMVASFVAGQPG